MEEFLIWFFSHVVGITHRLLHVFSYRFAGSKYHQMVENDIYYHSSHSKFRSTEHHAILAENVQLETMSQGTARMLVEVRLKEIQKHFLFSNLKFQKDD